MVCRAAIELTRQAAVRPSVVSKIEPLFVLTKWAAARSSDYYKQVL